MRYRRAALTFLLFLFGTCVYRAATQAITVDEAFAYLKLINGPVSLLFTTYDACHHILYTDLSKLCVSVFGVSAFALRLPSLFAALLYFGVAYRFCLWLLGPGLRFLLAIALLCLNPFILDYLVAARGYGLALGCLFLAFYDLVRFAASGSGQSAAPRLVRSGLALSASVAANLTMLFPALALMVVAVAIVVFLRRGGVPAIQRYLASVFVPAFLLMVLPLSHATHDNFYYGTQSFASSLQGIAGLSTSSRLPLFLPERWNQLLHNASGALIAVLPIVCILLVIPLAFALKTAIPIRFRALDGTTWTLLISGAATCITLGGLLAAHWLFHVPYPLTRTGLYLVLLFTLHLIAAIEWSRTWKRIWAWNARVLGAVACLFVCLFILGFRVSYFADWNFCRRLKPMLAIVERNRAPNKTIQIGGSMEYEPCVNFYREKRHLTWLKPMSRDKLDTGDFYLFTGGDRNIAAAKHLRILLSDPISQAVLAAPQEN